MQPTSEATLVRFALKPLALAGAPLREGKHIHQFVHDFSPPTYRLIEPDAEHALLRRAMKRARIKGDFRSRTRRRGEKVLEGDSLRPGGLESPFDQFRPGFRQVASATNERTVIAAVLPPGTALSESVHFFYRSKWDPLGNGYRTILPARAMVYVVGLLNSLVLDFVIRRKAGSHVTKSIMVTLPIADVSLESGLGADIARLAGRLTCGSPEFAELASVLGSACAPLLPGKSRLCAPSSTRGSPACTACRRSIWSWCWPTSGGARMPMGARCGPTTSTRRSSAASSHASAAMRGPPRPRDGGECHRPSLAWESRPACRREGTLPRP